jgi:hypothetical protein
MIGLSFDENGELYGWDIGNDSLWTIDKETGEASLVGPLGINLIYAQEGDFCKVDDKLYLAAYMSSPQYGNFLVECDKNTGECTIIGQFPEEYQQITLFVVPWNSCPYPPSNYSPCGEVVDNPFNMSWDGGDPDSEDMVTYDIYLSYYDPPSTLFATVGPYPANQTRIEFGPVNLSLCETYYWKVIAWDSYGACSDGPICRFDTCCSSPPTKPTIDGPSKGRPGVVYDYTFISTNPENFSIKYLIEWGDGNSTETEYCESGEPITLEYSWEEKGTYIIRAKAIDIYDQESEWSEFEVAIPRSRFQANSLFTWFLKRFLLFNHFIFLFD